MIVIVIVVVMMLMMLLIVVIVDNIVNQYAVVLLGLVLAALYAIPIQIVPMRFASGNKQFLSYIRMRFQLFHWRGEE